MMGKPCTPYKTSLKILLPCDLARHFSKHIIQVFNVFLTKKESQIKRIPDTLYCCRVVTLLLGRRS